MANATTRDARAGFAIYLQSAEGVTLDEINSRLEASGYGAIAQRTLTHYRNLVKAGFDRYISINRFDVARASRAYENMSTLSRYRYRSTDQEVSVLFSRSSCLLEAQGKLVESSDVGAVIEFSDEDILEELQRFGPGSLRGDASAAAALRAWHPQILRPSRGFRPLRPQRSRGQPIGRV